MNYKSIKKNFLSDNSQFGYYLVENNIISFSELLICLSVQQFYIKNHKKIPLGMICIIKGFATFNEIENALLNHYNQNFNIMYNENSINNYLKEIKSSLKKEKLFKSSITALKISLNNKKRAAKQTKEEIEKISKKKETKANKYLLSKQNEILNNLKVQIKEITNDLDIFS